MSLKHDIEFRLNGVATQATVGVATSTLEMMRDVLGLTGTKYGCGEGECGACTILVDGQSVNSCLLFALDCDGREVTTIEGLAANPRADALRDAFVANGAVQCGFCTPGMMVQAHHLLDSLASGDESLAQHDPSGKAHCLDETAIKRGIEGNLCRCTGYRKIVDAIAAVAAPSTPAGGER